MARVGQVLQNVALKTKRYNMYRFSVSSARPGSGPPRTLSGVQEPGDVDHPPTERGPRADTIERMLTAAFRILLNEGAHALTPQRVHRETGLARTTVYRNWPTRAHLMTAMLERATGNQDIPDFIDDLEHDLTVAVASLIFRFNERPLRPLFGALVEHGRHEGSERGSSGTEHLDDLAAQYIDGVLAPIRRAIEDGVRRGDLAISNADTALLDLCGPLLAKHVLLGQPTTDADGEEVTGRFLTRYRA